MLDGTSLGLFKVVSIVLFEKHSTPPKNLIGLGADNCATMMGKVSGFQAQLKEACPHIFVNGTFVTIWHCVYPMLPRNCLLELKTFFATFAAIFLAAAKDSKNLKIFKNCNAPRHAIMKIDQTRWLSHQQVVEQILEQWESLHTFFQQEVTSLAEKDLSHRARDLAFAFI